MKQYATTYIYIDENNREKYGVSFSNFKERPTEENQLESLKQENHDGNKIKKIVNITDDDNYEFWNVRLHNALGLLHYNPDALKIAKKCADQIIKK